jgi:uncharacterized protein (TIGR02598 family)
MKSRMMFVARVRSRLIKSWRCRPDSLRAKIFGLAQRLHPPKSINLAAGRVRPTGGHQLLTVNLRSGSFTLAEVVLSLGVIAIAVTTILALFPVALTTGRSAQDTTRAPEIVQAILSSVASQAQTQFNNVQLPLAGNTTLSIDLTASSSPTTPTLYADNDGNLISATAQNAAIAVYAIYIFANNSPPGFPTPPPAYANQVTVRVACPANAPAANQTNRDYVRIISKY